MNYAWEPAIEPWNYGCVLSDFTFGMHYAVLQVEQDLDGWHGLIIQMEDEEPVLVDEVVRPSKYDAVLWLEGRDTTAYQSMMMDEDDPDDLDMWNAMLDEEGQDWWDPQDEDQY